MEAGWYSCNEESFILFVILQLNDESKQNMVYLRGRVKFPTGGDECMHSKPASLNTAGFGEIPKPTV